MCERLLAEGHQVRGLDAFIPYYPRWIKEDNLSSLRRRNGFTFHEIDLRTDNLAPVVQGINVVFHLAAMPGLVKSWTDFDLYASCNLTATQRLLDALRGIRLQRFIYGSTSSVYGRFSTGDEALPTRPVSPYGVTKLAAESLCRAHENFGLPVVVLRYFSVYGPRQRPDMGYYHFIDALLKGETLTIFGDGLQVRGNTYVDDCVAATLAALSAQPGETYNVGGGEAVSVWDVIGRLEKIIGRSARIQRQPVRDGDQRFTLADTSRLTRHLGWRPRTTLDEGLRRQVAWQQLMFRSDAAAA
jgi:nucleoside-diphosphate-sugar epimerase